MKKQLIYVLMGLILTISACKKSETLSDQNPQLQKSTESELVTLKSGVVVEKRGNNYIFLGDILLSESQYKLLGETGTIFTTNNYDTSNRMSLNSIPVSSRSGIHYFQTTSPRSVGWNPAQNMFWSMVRYIRNNNLSYTSRYYIDEAIAHWEATTNVRFYDATGEPTVDPTYGFAYPYVEFVEVVGNVSSSQVGRLGGKQILEVGQISSIGTVIHEIGHAIGLFHEQNKPGRNNYINVDLNNVIDSFKHNFQEISDNYYAIGAGIDFGSIMMYHPKAFAINTSTEVITKKDGSSYLPQYQRDGLSSLDRAFANTFYLPFKPRFDTYRELDNVVYKPDNTIMTSQERLNLQASLNNGNPNPPPNHLFKQTGIVNMNVLGLPIREIVTWWDVASSVVISPSNSPFLTKGQFINTVNGLYRLEFQHDGNLVIYNNSNSQALWSILSVGTNRAGVWFQPDANLVVYSNLDGTGPIWASHKQSSNLGSYYGLKVSDVRLVFQHDGNLVLVLPEPASGLMGVIAATRNHNGVPSSNFGSLQ
ncbi:M12 family metallopeptidase [Niabella yanshanensis]|uniref:M12 family metallopeptidase n=1 Tax=Niabella yanshanensis TaxID=577386 RepID=A0ABZ0W119_9BACT|nr:M12 family metallopeptidase [Niabella yanshanensis]WQD36892.1 M12 family metallopeptidase [Niabella yanshanensis]